MKVRLAGINLESVPDVPTGDGNERVHGSKEILIARLASREGDPYCYFTVPAEMVRGAEIGDEFTLHLEHVKK